ncbi:hypothetical protein AC249_AIPGENE765 [Exaiptasia diaphana]|nr:hypothetical protein AC249_AIPGENE765 [Exaiptasia diaphana]
MVNKKSAKKDKTSSAKSSTGFSQSTEDLSQIQSTSNSAFQTSLPRASSLYSPTKPLTTCAAATNPLQTTSGSGTWEYHVDKIQLGGVYHFSPVQIRTWDDKKKLTTLKAIEIVLAPENENQFEDIAVDENETSDLTT